MYTTVENLKTYLWITTDELDITLNSVIKRVTAQFDKYLGRHLLVREYVEYIDLDDENLLIINNGPIISIESIQVDDLIQHTRIDGNIVYLDDYYTGTATITYSWWYPTLDDVQDVEQACLEVCKDIWDNTPSSGNESNIKSKQIETLSKTYFSKNEMAWGIWVSFRETLDNYKILNPIIC